MEEDFREALLSSKKVYRLPRKLMKSSTGVVERPMESVIDFYSGESYFQANKKKCRFSMLGHSHGSKIQRARRRFLHRMGEKRVLNGSGTVGQIIWYPIEAN